MKTRLFRLLKLLLFLMSGFIGLEAGLWIWELNKSQIQSAEPSSQRLILALGDSVSQFGYAKVLESVRHEHFQVENMARSGSGMEVMLKLFEQNRALLSKQHHQVIMMTGHNDCQYLRQFAQLHVRRNDEPLSLELKRYLWKLHTVRFLHLLWLNYSLPPVEPILTAPPLVSSEREHCAEIFKLVLLLKSLGTTVGGKAQLIPN